MKLIPKRFALYTLLCCTAPFVVGQNASTVSTEVERHIQHVQAGLVGSVVLKDDPHPTHHLRDRMRELNVPGVSIAVIHHGAVEWARGFGVSSKGGPPVNAETMFQAGAISKPVTAMAALRLVEQGKLSLDADVNTLLTSWKLPSDPVAAGKPVTVRELLTHTAGITVHHFPGYASNEPVPTLVQVLNGERPAKTPAIRSEAVPGAGWKYSGGGYAILQQMLVDVTREPFPRLLRDTILAPIGMTHSTYEQPLPQALQPSAATPYRSDGKPVEGGAHIYPEMAAIGLWTTPTDLARYAIEVEKSLQGKANHVLSVKMTRQMVTPGMGNWGLGLAIDGAASNPYFTYGGLNEGFQSTLVVYEKSGEGAVVMTNSDNGGRIANEIMHSIAAEYRWPDYRTTVRAAVAVDPKILGTYTGTYEPKLGFTLAVSVENGQLFAQAPGQDKFRLYAESETKFFLTISEATIEFIKDGQGKVTHFVLHQNGHDIKAPKK